MATMVLARIRRMGKQWASCGIPVRPPEHLLSNPTIKRRCPKLVPGQVIEVPRDHNLLNQDAVEIVRKVERDEFKRPWVFSSAEAAAMADPTRSRMGADQIAAGLALAEGAQRKGLKALEEREANKARADLDEEQRDEMDRVARQRDARGGNDSRELDEPEDDEDDYEPTTQNRVSKEEAEELRGKSEEDEPEEAKPARGRGRSTPRASRRG